ncbi:retrovirus-related pol polyprotein from transposon tnt 1-94 [Nephila pilipes]|uniref:Retrovirus-related pol polyprotein from transposon tnt 1-94 n=1 Tax=Nephila pilipes TaxID=299642 RepID=A0A8X6MGG3_NEPPI|nr:retrovirus-related pol polyprotein from transposon tnt 1-94 [Nephila pilipes]
MKRCNHQDKCHFINILEKELGISINLDKELCESCVYVKAHRLSFGIKKKASEPGKLISADICGPFDKSFQNIRYLNAFKDSFIKIRNGYLIKEKSKVKNMLEYKHSHAKTIEYLVKELLSDNVGEFDNADVEEVLPSKRTIQRLIASYTSEQNGEFEP